MWRLSFIMLGLVVAGLCSACSIENSPKRLPAYLAHVPVEGDTVKFGHLLANDHVTAALVVMNDTGFEKSAPSLQEATLQSLGAYLQAEIQKQVPINVSSIIYLDPSQTNDIRDPFVQLAQEEDVPFLLLAVLSSSEWEVPDRLPLGGFQQPTGLRSGGLVGYRAENYARLELALIDGKKGQPVVTSDGQAWATLERLAVPLESNVYPVVRRPQTQPPIYPNSEEDAFETLRWVSGHDAIEQAVMHLEEAWVKGTAS